MDGSVVTRKAGAPRAGIAERIWDAARSEFSKRGYHGARVQGIARGAACNVALIYRHWASKRALYLDILRAVWLGSANEIARLVQNGAGRAGVGGRRLPRRDDERSDGRADPDPRVPRRRALPDPAHPDRPGAPRAGAARRARARGTAARDGGLDPVLAVVTVGGLAALVASSREAARPFVREPLAPDAWRRHVFDLLVNGLAASARPRPRRRAGGGSRAPTRGERASLSGPGRDVAVERAEGVLDDASRRRLRRASLRRHAYGRRGGGRRDPGRLGRAPARAGGPAGDRSSSARSRAPRPRAPPAGSSRPAWRRSSPGRSTRSAAPRSPATPSSCARSRRPRAMSVGYRALGTLEVALDDDHARVLAGRAEKLERARAAGRGARRGRRSGALEPGLSPEARGALFFADEASLDPRPLAPRGVRGCLPRRRDVRHGRGPADRGSRGGARSASTTPSGRIDAGAVVLAAGSWSLLVEGHGLPAGAVRPVRGADRRRRHAAAAPLARGLLRERLRRAARGRPRSSAARRWRTWAGRRRSPPAASATCSTSRSEIAPALAQAPVVETWSNFRPASPDGEPILGEGTIPGLSLRDGPHAQRDPARAHHRGRDRRAPSSGARHARGPRPVLARAARRHPRRRR